MVIPDFYTPAKYVGSPWYSSRDGIAPEAVVLHVADGSVVGCDDWFNNTTWLNPATGIKGSRVSAHFVVGKDAGEGVHQYTYLSNGAWANGGIEDGATAQLIAENPGINPNRWTVSVEHSGTWPEEPTPWQFEASAQLTAWLFKNVLLPGGATGVAVDRKHVLRHSDISPLSRAHCPGWSEVTLARYIARVKAIVDGTASAYTAAVVEHLNVAKSEIDKAIAAALADVPHP